MNTFSNPVSVQQYHAGIGARNLLKIVTELETLWNNFFERIKIVELEFGNQQIFLPRFILKQWFDCAKPRRIHHQRFLNYFVLKYFITIWCSKQKSIFFKCIKMVSDKGSISTTLKCESFSAFGFLVQLEPADAM